MYIYIYIYKWICYSGAGPGICDAKVFRLTVQP